MQPIFLLVGGPGVGKSTTARTLAATFPTSIHIPVDDLRHMVVGGLALPEDAWPETLARQITLARAAAVRMAIDYANAGFAVVLDDFWDPHDLADYRELLARPTTFGIVLKPTLAEARCRNASRVDDGTGDYIDAALPFAYGMLERGLSRAGAGEWLVLDTTDMPVDGVVTAILGHATAGPASSTEAPVLIPSYPITTERLILRPYETGDLPALHDLFGREDVCRYLYWEPLDLEAARRLLERRVRKNRIENEGDGLLLAAVDVETGRMIGEFMLHYKSAQCRLGEVGWSLHPDVQGRGLATEGAREMLRLGFDEMGLHRIIAECAPRNVASLRVMERLGMRREALFVEDQLVKGAWVGTAIAAILASEWRNARD